MVEERKKKVVELRNCISGVRDMIESRLQIRRSNEEIGVSSLSSSVKLLPLVEQASLLRFRDHLLLTHLTDLSGKYIKPLDRLTDQTFYVENIYFSPSERIQRWFANNQFVAWL